MATGLSTGWTGASLLPSYAVLSNILGPASGSVASNSIPASVAGAGAGVAPVHMGNTGGFMAPAGPSIPANNSFSGGLSGTAGPTVGPYGYPGRGSGGAQMNTGAFDQAGNPIYTPDQAYAMYMQHLSNAIMTTPQQQLLNQMLHNASQMAYMPSSIPIGGPGGAGNTATSAYDRSLRNQATVMTTAYPSISPYSTAYGTPAVQAPAPNPYGYATGYGQAPPVPGTGRSAPNSGWTTGIGMPMY